MRRTVAILLAILIVAVAWLFFKHFDVRGFEQVQVVPKAVDGRAASVLGSDWTEFNWSNERPTKKTSFFGLKPKSSAQQRTSIRICAFNIQAFGSAKAAKYGVMEVIAQSLRRFDIVAIQELQSDRPDVLPKLVDLMNQSSSRNLDFDFAVGPRLGTTAKQQYAFVFNKETVYLDRNETYTVEDPNDGMVREPLVGWFRARGVDTQSAFTFSLVNVNVEMNRRIDELNLLDDILYAIRRDGRNEDDVILAGNFCAASRQMEQLSEIPGIVTAIAETPTTTDGTNQCDNIVFQLPATEEFTGRSGVFDFMREYNLPLERAMEVSDHLPVWAEFSIYEGGTVGRVAPVTTEGRAEIISIAN